VATVRPDGELEMIESALAAIFPALARPLRRLQRGFGSTVVETPDGIIFRVARHARAAEGHSREVSLLPALRQRLGVAVPEPEWHLDPRPPGLPYGAIGYRKLPGQEPSRERMGPADSARLAAEMAEVLVALHAFPLEEAKRLGLQEADRDPDGRQFEALCDEVMPVLRERLSPVEFETVICWTEDFRDDGAIDRFRPAVRHGDLWYGNLLVDEATGTLAAVLDWEEAAIGDIASDLARQLHFGEQFFDAVLDAYGARGGRLDAHARRRVERRWELLEFAGIRAALLLEDRAELEETVDKLRRGPILA
jgi:aminoglycoside phosphotransferase (APT) family kinase protein